MMAVSLALRGDSGVSAATVARVQQQEAWLNPGMVPEEELLLPTMLMVRGSTAPPRFRSASR